MYFNYDIKSCPPPPLGGRWFQLFVLFVLFVLLLKSLDSTCKIKLYTGKPFNLVFTTGPRLSCVKDTRSPERESPGDLSQKTETIHRSGSPYEYPLWLWGEGNQ